MGYYPSDCDNLTPHDCDPCEQREYARVRSAGFIQKDYIFDPSNAADWLAGIDMGTVILIPETHGSVSAAATKLGPGYGETFETLLGYDFSAKIYDPNYVSNVAFYNQIIGNRDFKFFYRTSSHVHITNVPVTIIPNTEIKDDLNGEVIWMVDVKWIDQQFAEPVLTPAGVFDSCFIMA